MCMSAVYFLTFLCHWMIVRISVWDKTEEWWTDELMNWWTDEAFSFLTIVKIPFSYSHLGYEIYYLCLPASHCIAMVRVQKRAGRKWTLARFYCVLKLGSPPWGAIIRWPGLINLPNEKLAQAWEARLSPPARACQRLGLGKHECCALYLGQHNNKPAWLNSATNLLPQFVSPAQLPSLLHPFCGILDSSNVFVKTHSCNWANMYIFITCKFSHSSAT